MSKLFAGHICVTGTIGCGKSRVAQFLAEHCGLPFVDVDDIARDIMHPGGSGFVAISEYNPSFITADNLLDRSALRLALFNSPEVKADVDALLHPLIHSALLDVLQGFKSRVVIEIPLLYETGWEQLFDVIVVVYASKENCLERIIRRDGVTRIEADAAYKSQIDMELKKKMTPYIVDNNGSWAATIKKIVDVASKLPSV